MEYKDYYATLGVAKSVSADDLQKAYRKLARQFHPDVNQTQEAETRFKEINEAYEVLKDPEKRKRYDQFGSAWKQAQRTGAPPPGFEDIFTVFTGSAGPSPGGFNFGGEGFSSFFEMLFGTDPRSARGGGRRAWNDWRPTQGPPRGGNWSTQAGADHEATISLSLEDAARGGQHELTISHPTTGRPRKLRITLPKGVRPGKRIRLSGQGGDGAGGGPRGDLYLTVELLPHPVFRLEEEKLYTRLQVTPWEAVLGGTATVPTLNGPVKLRIPAGSSSGRKIRLPEKGFPRADGPAGDLYAEIQVVVPEEPTEDERKLFEDLASASRFDPRGEQPVS